MADETENTEQAPSFNIEFYAPDETPTLYSDSQFVLHTGNEFVISFYQTQYPPMGDVVKPKDTSIRSRCLVRIIVSPVQMQKLVGALSSNLEKVEKKKDKPAGE